MKFIINTDGGSRGNPKPSRVALQQLAPANPAVRELRDGKTPVFPTPFPGPGLH
ncbi:hypothetical protein M1413_03900 [Patescibacteria group bacterium]|nr:hypothetical protein [Patescibacteria group bacterium]MCL5114850.1 hypothetical protein [Patescibacteria group bacterium]